MQTIDRDELKRMNEQEERDFVLLNVLPRDEFREQHIRTSVNVFVGDDDFTDKVEQIAGGKDREIVVYCASEDCPASSNAVKKLEKAGFQRVYDYEGGTRDWFEQKQAA